MLSAQPTVGGLFSGIAGLELGFERAGCRTIWHAENDPYCRQVLAHHYPHVPNLGDVTTIDWSTLERPDILVGGYPCQPFSLAGQRKGETDPRHLWPHMAAAIRHLRPRYAVLENVPGHRSLGFGDVLGDLAACGYDAEWDCIPALAVGAPHRRDRVFIVAYPQRDPVRTEPLGIFGFGSASLPWHDGRARPVADADGAGLEERWPGSPVDDDGHWAVEPDVGRVADGVPHRVDRLRALGSGERRSVVADADGEREPQPSGPLGAFGGRAGNGGEPARPGSAESRLGGSPDGAAAWLDGSWEHGLPRSATGVPNRTQRLRALGNGVVPQVAEHVARCILAADAR